MSGAVHTPESPESRPRASGAPSHTLVAALSSALVRRLEDLKTRLGAGRGHLIWIFSSVALLSGFGFKLKLNFYRCARGVPFLVQAISCLWFLPCSEACARYLPLASPSRAGAGHSVGALRAYPAMANACFSRGPLGRIGRLLRSSQPHEPVGNWT